MKKKMTVGERIVCQHNKVTTDGLRPSGKQLTRKIDAAIKRAVIDAFWSGATAEASKSGASALIIKQIETKYGVKL